MKARLAAVLAIVLAACRAPLATPATAPAVPAGPGITLNAEPSRDHATIVLSVAWPRRVQSLPPTADHLSFRLKGADGLPTIPDLDRPAEGATMPRQIQVEVPVANLQVQCTATNASRQIVAQSTWQQLNLRRNARISVQLEVLAATGTDPDHTAFMQPEIDSVTPDRGYPILTTVQLLGKNFGFSQGLGTVSFGGQQAAPASIWTDSITGGTATISVVVPVSGKTGPLKVRLGPEDAQVFAQFNGFGGGGDPWGQHFSVLGSVSEPQTVDTGAIQDYLAFWSGSSYVLIWTRAAAGGQTQLMGTILQPDAQVGMSAVTLGPTVQLSSAPGIGLGGVVPDFNGAWVVWQETGPSFRRIKLNHIAAADLVSGVSGEIGTTATVLSSSPVVPAQPRLARNSDGKIVAVWFDDRETTNLQRPRLYAQGIGADGSLLSTSPIPVQDSNSALSPTSPVNVGTPSISTDGTQFLASWQEDHGTGVYGLEFKRASFNANSLVVDSLKNSFQIDGSSNLWNAQLAYCPSTLDYRVVFERRVGTAATFSSADIYMQAIDSSGTPRGNNIRVTNDAETQGLVNCPSFDPGTPCGQGIRRKPQIVWNGRDLMLAWQFDRNDGEQDILGARLTRDGVRAPEEPPSPIQGVGAVRSVAEIVYGFVPNRPGLPLTGPQIEPRLVWGGDAHLVTYLEPDASGAKALKVRLWR